MGKVKKYHAIKVDAKKCFGCTHCLKVCPAEAIRIVDGIAKIDDERCVDCGNCMRACPADAFYLEHDDLSLIHNFKYKVALFPSVMVGQFPEDILENQIYECILKLGFTHVFEVEQPIQLLIDALNETEKKNKLKKPLISSFCPAIVRLIQIKYPGIVNNIVPLKAPHDLAAHFAIEKLKKEGAKENEIGIFYITPCSAKMAAVKRPMGEKESIVSGIINMNDFFNRVMQVLPKKEELDTSLLRKNLSKEGILWSLTGGEAEVYHKRSLAIDGIHNVVKILERLENEKLPEIDFLEMRSCSQSCAGGILLSGNRFLTVERLKRRASRYRNAQQLVTEELDFTFLKQKIIAEKIIPNPSFSLAEDRAEAMAKMNKAQKIICQLPGIDCGACGAPNCHALAEDMAQGKAKMSDCVFLKERWQKEGKISTEKGFENLEKIWGKNRFEADCNKKDQEMTVTDIVERFGLKVFSGENGLDNDVEHGYVSDLLSDVLGNAEENSVWITLQTHQNVVAVASLKDLAAIILVNGLEPDKDSVEHSNKEGIPMLGTNKGTFEIAGQLYEVLNKK